MANAKKMVGVWFEPREIEKLRAWSEERGFHSLAGCLRFLVNQAVEPPTEKKVNEVSFKLSSSKSLTSDEIRKLVLRVTNIAANDIVVK